MSHRTRCSSEDCLVILAIFFFSSTIHFHWACDSSVQVLSIDRLLNPRPVSIGICASTQQRIRTNFESEVKAVVQRALTMHEVQKKARRAGRKRQGGIAGIRRASYIRNGQSSLPWRQEDTLEKLRDWMEDALIEL